jgi:ribonuclease HI
MPVFGQASVPELVAVTSWYLWWERCKATRGEKVQDPENTARAIDAIYSNFYAANTPKAKPKRGGWLKPLKDYVKINVDASFDADQLMGTTGAVIRDCNGNFIAANNTKLEFAQDVLSAEAHAMKQGLLLAQVVGCNRIIISSDNRDAVEIMQEGGNSSGVAAAIFDDCYYLSSEFSRVQFEHSFWEANSVAHELARVARGSQPQVWLDHAPDFLVPLIRNDVIVIAS